MHFPGDNKRFPESCPVDQASCRRCCIKINDLTVRLHGNVILERLDLHVHCGEILAVVGPNGAGKTTLLRAIMGEVPYKGTMTSLMGGADRRRPRIGYVPQKLQFDPDSPVNVADLVVTTISRRPVWTGISPALFRRAQEILGVFSADHLMRRRIGELSGGELQRVLLAMAMTSEPELLLLDEPGTGVDARGLALFYRIVGELREHHHVSVILITHDLAGIATLADRLILLNHFVVASGAPRDVLSDEKMIHTFGPGLWNISALPDEISKESMGHKDSERRD